MRVRVIVARHQQRAVGAGVQAKRSEVLIDLRQLGVGAAVEIDAHVPRAFGDMARAVGHSAAASALLARREQAAPSTSWSAASPTGLTRKWSNAAASSGACWAGGYPVTA